MEKSDIETAIEKARKGISQYLVIMECIFKTDVSTDTDFQRKYNGFYRVRQRPQEWYRTYFELMEELKGKVVEFDNVLDELKKRTGRYEPSFSSKLVATLNSTKPIWDVHILANTSHKAPAYSNGNKVDLAKKAYQSIGAWYESFIQTAAGKLCIVVFDEKIKEHSKISDLKKIDFILWQIRSK